MKQIIRQRLDEHLELAKNLHTLEEQIETVASVVVECLKRDNKLIFLGNGGSAVDAMHMAGEYVSKFSKNRKGLPALALPSNIAVITSIANDWNYEYVFARQLESLANSHDIVISFSTSGESKNVINAIEFSQNNDIMTVSFTGSRPNTVARLSQYAIQIPSTETARIQETYILINHIICEIVDDNY